MTDDGSAPPPLTLAAALLPIGFMFALIVAAGALGALAVTLGVPTLSYAPWAVFCYGGPFFSLLIAALYRRTRFGIRPRTPDGSAA